MTQRVVQNLLDEAKWWHHPSTSGEQFNRAFVRITLPVNLGLNLLPFIIMSHIAISPAHPNHFPNVYHRGSFLYYAAYVFYLPANLYTLSPLLRNGISLSTSPNGRRHAFKSELAQRPENISIVYRSLQLITTDISFLFGRLILPIQAVFGQCVITSAYFLIGGRARTDTATLMIFWTLIPFTAVSWTIMLAFSGIIYQSANRCIASWKSGAGRWERGEDRLYMKKFRMSCKPIYIGYPGLITVTPKTALMIVQGIVRGTTRDLARLWNCGIKFGQSFVAKWWRHPPTSAQLTFNRSFLRITRPANLALNLLPLIIVSHVAVFPRHPIHFPNVYHPGSLLYYAAYVFYFPANLYTLCYFTQYVKLVFQAYTYFILLVVPILRNGISLIIPPRQRRHPFKYDLVQRPENIFLTYRTLQLIMKDMSFVFGRLIAPIQVVFGQCVITSAYFLIGGGARDDSVTSMILWIVIPFTAVSWTVMLAFSGIIYQSANRCIASWKRGAGWWDNGEDRNYMKKFRISCKPIYIGYPGLITVTSKTALMFVQGIVRGTVRTLLAFKKKR
ncbi:hypothetical protein Fcan01_25796 [Folsomia candida]|uniref:Uncharacterized protein n=1 Tax=Folsomia candida TaxID=158441 RepID=A0A226D3M7_FOLCA|nr:hypothetical protein Fcan01_25796 [Folsomia candida]